LSPATRLVGQEEPPGAEKPVNAPPSDGWNVFFGTTSGTFIHGFIATLSVILVSELGDKTFFIGKKLRYRFETQR